MSKTTFTAVPGSHEVVMERVFEARRDRLFAAYTDPKAVPSWWGPRSLTTHVDKMDPKAGGLWRFVQRDAEGNEYAFRGVYHEVRSPDRLVYTFEYEGMPEHVVLETVAFEEQGAITRLRAQSVFQSVAARDGMMEHGMEVGAVETWDRLAELLGNA